MEAKKVALLMVMLFYFSYNTHAQITTDTLNEVEVKAKNTQAPTDDRVTTFSSGTKVYTFDKRTLDVYRFQNMANLITQQMPVFIKSFGVNNLATLSFRGASAAQSQVYWNGVPIQNAATGIADVSLLPVSLMNRVNVVYGSSSALWGSGNVGGALLIDNDLPQFCDSITTNFNAAIAAGSFGQRRVDASASWANKNITSEVRMYGQSAKNNFTYTKDGNNIKLDNANMNSLGGLLQFGVRVNDNNSIGIKLWYQDYYREIPPALFESSSVKQQTDESLRILADWNRVGDKTSFYTKLSFIQDKMHYDDSVILQHTDNTTRQVYFESGLSHKLNSSHQFKVFTPIQYSWIYRVLSNDNKTQTRYALATAYSGIYFKQKLNISLQARGEVVNNKSFFLPGFSAKYMLRRWIDIIASAQRTYRVPTLNELYYSPGGNEKLKPEKGWAQSLGYSMNGHLGNNDLYITHSASVYNRNINDWILWFGGAIWTPHNISKVHSRGIETENQIIYSLNKVRLHLKLNGAYNIATTVNSYQPNDGSIDKQIPYTPRYNGQINVGFLFKRFYFNYNHTYTGVRYITTDESFGLEGYDLSNVQMMYHFILKKTTVRLIAQANNILNKQYYVVNARPMPQCNGTIGLSVSF